MLSPPNAKTVSTPMHYYGALLSQSFGTPIEPSLDLNKINMTGSGKRVHFAQELNFQYMHSKSATPQDFVHNSECYNLS